MQLFRDGQPIFYDENGYGQLSDTALWFIGGLLKHAASLCAITNPSTTPTSVWSPALRPQSP